MDIMDDYNEFITNRYTIKYQNILFKLFKLLANINKLQELDAVLIEYFNSNITYGDSDAGNIVSNLIGSYVADNVIVSECGISINKTFVYNMLFLVGLLEFHSTYTAYSPAHTDDINSILSDDELENEHKLGLIIEIYEPDFYPLEAYDIIDIINTDVIQKYLDGNIMASEVEKSDPETLANLMNDLLGISNKLITSDLTSFIITRNMYDITDKQMLDYILGMRTTNIDEDKLVIELSVYKVISGNTVSDVINTVNDLFEDMNTVKIVNGINTMFEGVHDVDNV